MPETKRWVQFLGGAGLIMVSGILFTKYMVPNDEQFLKELSPDLRAQYERERSIRRRADEIMALRVADTQNRPAWLESSAKMRKLDAEVTEEARKQIDILRKQEAEDDERIRLKTLALKEKR